VTQSLVSFYIPCIPNECHGHEKMEEVEKVSEALKLVEKYENYLFRKAWGISLIVWGILIPLSSYLVLKAQPIATILDTSVEAFMTLVTAMTLIVCAALTIYTFVSAEIATLRRRRFSFRRDVPHAVIISLIWFVFFRLTAFVPERFGVVSLLWAPSGACLLSYLVLRKVHGGYLEVLLVGLILLIASLPVVAISDVALAQIATLVIFAVSFVIGGLYSIIAASKALSENRR
jgi:hypothetical protein